MLLASVLKLMNMQNCFAVSIGEPVSYYHYGDYCLVISIFTWKIAKVHLGKCYTSFAIFHLTYFQDKVVVFKIRSFFKYKNLSHSKQFFPIPRESSFLLRKFCTISETILLF